jgi:diguanylate cyclase (GGDEF)-like protein
MPSTATAARSFESAHAAVERMRADVAALAIAHPACGADAVVTVSAGIARLEQSDAGDFEAVLKRADAALYRAKELGRNRVEIGSREPRSGALRSVSG